MKEDDHVSGHLAESRHLCRRAGPRGCNRRDRGTRAHTGRHRSDSDTPIRRQPSRRLGSGHCGRVASWNANVSNVRLVEAAPGARAEIVIVATTGWPQATLGPVRPGRQVRVELGAQAVSQGYDKTRIAAHELGHSLGLPDTKPGPCSQLMSGSSAGTACTNAVPNATERSRVQNAYANGFAAAVPTDGRVLIDAP